MLNRFSSNATANILSGVVAAAYQLSITAIAVSTWDSADFATWGLAMSIAAIAPILSANLSSVMTRRLVEVRHGGSREIENSIVLAGRRISRILACVAFVSLFTAGAWIHMNSAPGLSTTSGFLILLALLLLTNTWLLLWQVRFGQAYAEERNWVPALISSCARAGGMLGMISVLALGSTSLVQVALGLFVGTWITLGLTHFSFSPRRSSAAPESKPTKLEIRHQFWRNLRILYGFAFGVASSIVIQYSITPLIALIEPELFNAFYLASTLNVVAIGVLSSAMSALLAPFTRWHATRASQAVIRIGFFSPALCAGVSLAALFGCWTALEFVLDLMTLSSANVGDIRHFLILLGLQTIVRTSAAGFATYVSSAGTSRQMAVPLAIEILLALFVAVPLGWKFGVDALLLGLTFAALIGSQFSSKTFASLCNPNQITTRVAFASLLLAQVVGSALWWWLVSNNG